MLPLSVLPYLLELHFLLSNQMINPRIYRTSTQKSSLSKLCNVDHQVLGIYLLSISSASLVLFYTNFNVLHISRAIVVNISGRHSLHLFQENKLVVYFRSHVLINHYTFSVSVFTMRRGCSYWSALISVNLCLLVLFSSKKGKQFPQSTCEISHLNLLYSMENRSSLLVSDHN